MLRYYIEEIEGENELADSFEHDGFANYSFEKQIRTIEADYNNLPTCYKSYFKVKLVFGDKIIFSQTKPMGINKLEKRRLIKAIKAVQ